MSAIGEIIWTPSTARIEASAMERFRLAVHGRAGADDYAGLWQWSIDEPAAFWRALWDFAEVVGTPGERGLEPGASMREARFFPDARLNFAENLLRRRGDEVVMVAWLEDGRRRQLTAAELHDEVAACASALRSAGVGVGDRVAGLLPNVPETVIAMLASASIGAVWTSCSPDFGEGAVVDRFGQVAPKVLITCDGYHYGGKRIDLRSRLPRLLGQLPGVEQCVVVPVLGDGAPSDGELLDWEAFLDRAHHGIEFVQLPFDHPLYILYSSGTTGAPKCIVHGAGGTLLQHLKEHMLHTDIGPGDVLFYFTTCGWMMWNWLVSGLAAGARLVLYDGSPFHPRPRRLWRLAAEEGVTVFGTSAKYLAACEKARTRPARDCDLSTLRTLLSTGSPLLPEQYDWILREVGDDVQIASISGGTDIVSCFALGNPLLPVRRGELQCRGLGMAVDVFDDDGRPVRGEQGELVCTRPFPSMPVGFWNDPDGERYRSAYFDRFDDVWCHGDWAEITEHDGVIIHGRSDAVLNPGGVRIGTAEIYRQVDQLDEIGESICVGQQWDGDVRVVLFVVPAEGVTLTDELRERIRRAIRDGASPRHVPARILEVTDIPRTRSGKISEIAVRDVVHGREVANTDALANPEALTQYRDRAELLE